MSAYSLYDLPLGCPIDGSPLSGVEPCSLRCGQGHTFDIAKLGYANLLPVQFKPSRDPGDSKPMVLARQAVFASGLFRDVQETLVRIVADRLNQSTGAVQPPLIVDAGCGEGYYTQSLSTELSVRTLGADISKPAIQLAARQYKTPCFVIANNKKLPVAVGSPTVITSLFGFETWEPWSALQSPGQSVVCVSAGRDHLKEIRQIIYPEVITHDPPEPVPASLKYYRSMQTVPVKRVHTSVDPEITTPLLTMTPHGVKAGVRGISALQETGPLPVTIDVIFRIYERVSP